MGIIVIPALINQGINGGAIETKAGATAFTVGWGFLFGIFGAVGASQFEKASTQQKIALLKDAIKKYLD